MDANVVLNLALDRAPDDLITLAAITGRNLNGVLWTLLGALGVGTAARFRL
jgi:hypothetical protein